MKKQKLCAYPFIEYNMKHIKQIVLPLSEQEKFFVSDYYETNLSNNNLKKSTENLTTSSSKKIKKEDFNSMFIISKNTKNNFKSKSISASKKI